MNWLHRRLQKQLAKNSRLPSKPRYWDSSLEYKLEGTIVSQTAMLQKSHMISVTSDSLSTYISHFTINERYSLSSSLPALTMSWHDLQSVSSVLFPTNHFH